MEGWPSVMLVPSGLLLSRRSGCSRMQAPAHARKSRHVPLRNVMLIRRAV